MIKQAVVAGMPGGEDPIMVSVSPQRREALTSVVCQHLFDVRAQADHLVCLRMRSGIVPRPWAAG